MIAFSLVSEVIISPILVFRTDSTFRFSLQFRALCFSKMVNRTSYQKKIQLLGPVINGNKMYSTSETGQKISLLLFTIFDCSSLTVTMKSREKNRFIKFTDGNNLVHSIYATIQESVPEIVLENSLSGFSCFLFIFFCSMGKDLPRHGQGNENYENTIPIFRSRMSSA